MVKRFGVALSVVLLVFSMVGTAGAAAVFVDGVSLASGWSDVNKANVSGPPDSLLCWAAAGSNALSYAGWRGWDSGASAYISTASGIYSEFVAAWPNTVGSSTYAYEWWMTNRTESNIHSDPLDPLSPSAKVFPSAGLNFYPTVHVQDGDPAGVTAFVKDASVPGFLATYIGANRGIVGSISIPFPTAPGGELGHAISIWGYDPALQQIFITDSDDGLTGLRTYGYHVDGSGFLVIDDYTNLYTTARDVTIDQLTRLNRNDLGIEPDKGTITPPPQASPSPARCCSSGPALSVSWAWAAGR